MSECNTTAPSPRLYRTLLGLWAVLAAAVAILAGLPADTQAQCLMSVIGLGTMILLVQRSSEDPNDWRRAAILVFGIFLSLRYMVWRTFFTMHMSGVFDHLAAWLLYAAEAYAFVIFGLGIFVNFYPLRRPALRLRPDDPDIPTLDILVPSYNESAELLEVTLRCCLAVRYPAGKKNIYLCDDGGTEQKRNDANVKKRAEAIARRHELKALCERLGCHYLTRDRNVYAKAGNINAALEKTNGDLILILDADHVPTADMLERTVPWFMKDEKVFLVQTPHFMINPDPIERNLFSAFHRMPAENEMFYVTIQRGLDYWDSSFFCGSAAVLRRSALAEVGGLTGDSITEDAETAMELHMRGYKSVYVEQPMVGGLAPESFTGFVVQRMRWAQGMTQIMLLKLPGALRKMKWYQSLCYVNACLFWMFPLARLVFLLSPCAYLVFGLQIYNANISEILVYTVPHVVGAQICNSLLFKRTRWPLISELYELMQSVYTMMAIVQVFLNPRKPKFVVTPKSEMVEEEFVSPLVRPFYVLFGFVVLASLGGLVRFWLLPDARPLTVVVLLWNFINITLISSAFGALFERRQRRTAPRMPLNVPAAIEAPDGSLVRCVIEDASAGGIRVQLDKSDAKIRFGDQVFINVRIASRQLDTRLKMEIRAAFKIRGNLGLGCRFVDLSEEDRELMYSLMYGDSESWSQFAMRRQKPMHFLPALGFIFRLSYHPILNHLFFVLNRVLAKGPPMRLKKILPLVALLFPLVAGAAEVQPVVPTAPVGETGAGPVHYRYPLSKFIPAAGPLTLHDEATTAKISIPLSGRLKLKSMAVTLNFTSSIALVPNTSVLAVRFNETTLQQIRLDPSAPVNTVKVNIPVELARPGYNQLSLAVSQHNGDPCEDPEAPELWTEINTANSALDIDGDYAGGNLHLSDFDQIFSPGIGAARRLSLVTPPLGNNSGLIEAAALVAEAVSLRAKYETVDLHPAALASPASWTLDDHVLIGTKDQLAAALGDEAEKIQGPYLSLRTLDKRQIQIVVSGRNPDELALAARALAYFDIPFADAQSATVKAITDSGAKNLQPDRIYGFEELGIPTTTLAGVGGQKLSLDLPMPPDLYAPENAAVDLLLDLGYGAGLGPGSVINVSVNDKFLHAIGLSNEAGAAFSGYRLHVPLRDLVGGHNHIDFNVIMRPLRKDRCIGASGRHLATTIYGTSSVQIPPASHVAAQPDLDLMARTGFPYAGSNPVTVWLSDPSLIGAGWSLVGRLAEAAEHPLPHLQFLIGGEPPHGPAILIGEAKSLPPRIFAGALQAIGQSHRVPYRAFDAPLGSATPGLFDQDRPLLPTEQRPRGDVEQSNELGDNIILTAVAADDGHGTTTVITANGKDQLIAGVPELISAQYWTQARGDFMLWKGGHPDQVTTLRLSPRYQIGSAPPLMSLRFEISQHPWGWLIGTMALLIAVSGLTVWLLARRRPKEE